MPRSPSPAPSRGSGGRGGYYNREARDGFRDRPFQAGRAHPDDRDGWNRNEGRTWGNYRSRRDDFDAYPSGRGESSRGGGGWYDERERRGGDGGYGGRGRSSSRSRSREPPPFRSSGSTSRLPSPIKSSRRSSATPEEGQITSPAMPPRGELSGRSPLPYHSPAPRRSQSPPRRYPRDDRNRDFERRPPPRDYRDRAYSPRRSRSPSSVSSRSRISSPEKPRPRSPGRRSPPPPEVRRPEVSQRPPWEDRKAGIHRPPPTGPRGDRAPPTGPRALSGSGPLPRIPPPSASSNPEVPTSPPRSVPAGPAAAAAGVNTAAVNPYDPSLAANQTPAGPRLSWSERKKLSPADLKPLVNPYAAPARVMAPQSAEASPSRMPHTPMQVDSPVTVSPIMGQRALPLTAIKSEAELAEIRAKEMEARVLAELPELKVPFGGRKWEIELAQHYASMQTLEQTTLRAQSNMRLQLAILVDAEIEYAAAGERRKVASAQHQLAIDQAMGILGS